MTDLGPLFDPSRLARATDPATSKAAAAQAVHVGPECIEVLDDVVAYLDTWGSPGTSRQIAAHATADPAWRFVVAKRLSVLERHGLVRRAGDAPDPETGRTSTRWEPTEAGAAMARSAR